MDALLHVAQRWLQPDQLSPSEMVECVALNKFLRAQGRKKSCGDENSKDLQETVTAIECTLSTLEIRRWLGRPWELNSPGELHHHPVAAYRALKWTEEQPPPKLAPADEPMPTESDRVSPKNLQAMDSGKHPYIHPPA